MGLKDWFTRTRRSPAQGWRDRWEKAAQARDGIAAAALRQELSSDTSLGSDLEIEYEMADALDRLIALAAELDAGRVPHVETSHRVVGTDACHFSAPASLPDDHSQVSGRVLLTSTRAVFVGGPRLASVPWHAVREAARLHRDVFLIRSADHGLRLRFNTYGDALEAAALASHLKQRSKNHEQRSKDHEQRWKDHEQRSKDQRIV